MREGDTLTRDPKLFLFVKKKKQAWNLVLLLLHLES